MNYLICSTGRARSGVLAKNLRSLNVGAPDEFYEHARFDLHTLSDAESVRDYLEAQRVDGILGMKMVWSHVRKMHQSLGLALGEFVETYLPEAKFLYVTRDPFKQGIESTIYTMHQQGVPLRRSHFCKETAQRRIVRVIIGMQAWEIFFEKYGVSPVRVDAEALQEMPQAVMQFVLDALGVERDKASCSYKFEDHLMTALRDEMYLSFVNRCQRFMSEKNMADYL